MSKIYEERDSGRIVEHTWSEEDMERLRAEKAAIMKSASETVDRITVNGMNHDLANMNVIKSAMDDRNAVLEGFGDGGLLMRHWHKEYCKLVKAEMTLDKLLPDRKGKIDLEAFGTGLGLSPEDPYIEPESNKGKL